MAWIYVPAARLDRQSGKNSEEKQYATSKTIHTAKKLSSKESKMALSATPQSGMTCKHSTENRGKESYNASSEESPANHTARQEKDSEKTMPVIFGPTSSGSFAKYDQSLCFWRTYQASLLTEEGWEEYSQTWPRAGMMQNGTVYRLQPSAPITAGIASGLWATPQARDYRTGQASRWNNPKRSRNLNDHVVAKASIWPTPTTQDAKNNGSISQHRRNSLPLNAAVMQKNNVATLLNPTWVCWMMGWPKNWTSTQPICKESMEEWKKSINNQIDWWEVDPANDNTVPRTIKETPKRASMLRMLGNGWVPQVAAIPMAKIIRRKNETL